LPTICPRDSVGTVRGTTRRRGSTWSARWYTEDPATGKRRHHEHGGFGTKTAAEDYLNEIVAKVAAGSWAPDRPLTVEALLREHWLPAQELRNLRPTTVAQYRNAADHWLIPYIGARRVKALTPADVTRLVSALKTGRGLSDRSVQVAVGVLKAACGWATNTGLLGRNPTAAVRLPRAARPHLHAWSVDEARSFLATTADDRLAFAWALLLTRGLRRGELCGLRWSDVDLDARVLRITHTRVVVDGHTVESAPKTSAGRRSIPLDDRLVALLAKHKSHQATEQKAAEDAYMDDGYLLADELGHPAHPDSFSRRFDNLVTKSQLPRLTIHGLRHTAATLMLADGVPTKVVTELLGHSSPTVTLGIYAHVLPGMAEDAGAALSKSLLG
jgi:integrase